MTPEHQARFGPLPAALRDGTSATIRPLRETDADALAEFYAAVPPEDNRFYAPHPLDRDHARQNAAAALSPTQVVLVLEPPTGGIGGYAWFRWEEGADRSGFGICLRRDFQGSGAGRLLMQRLLEIAPEIGGVFETAAHVPDRPEGQRQGPLAVRADGLHRRPRADARPHALPRLPARARVRHGTPRPLARSAAPSPWAIVLGYSVSRTQASTYSHTADGAGIRWPSSRRPSR